MSRHAKLHRIIGLSLIVLVFLLPALATAQPHQGKAALSAAARPEAGPSLFAKLRILLSVLWENGSILEPDGTGTKPAAAAAGDNGSGLEPDGRL